MKWLRVAKDMWQRRIPAGWLYRIENRKDLSPGRRFAVVFVPDPNHTNGLPEWEPAEG